MTATDSALPGDPAIPLGILPTPPLPWFDRFVALIQGSTGMTGRFDWPDPDAIEGVHYWDGFRAALDGMGAAWPEVEAAVRKLAPLGLRAPKVLGKLVELIEAARRGGTAPAADPGDPREAARRRSRVCPECSGTGRTFRYLHPKHRGKFGAIPVGGKIPLFCDCPLGWSLEEERAAGGADPKRSSLRRIAAFQDAPAAWLDGGLGNKYRFPPDAWDDEAGRPAGMPEWAASAARAAEFFRKQRGGAGAAGQPPPADFASSGVPAGLAARQEAFYGGLSADRRRIFNALPAGDRARLLELVGRPGPAGDRAAAAIVAAIGDLVWFAARLGETPPSAVGPDPEDAPDAP